VKPTTNFLLFPNVNNNNPEPVVAIDGLTFPIRVQHKGNSYDLSLIARRVGDPASTLSVMVRLDSRTATLNGRPGVPVSELRASGVNPPALTWGHKSFESAWRDGDFTVVVPGQQPGKPVPASSAGKELAMLLERIEWTNNLLLATGAARCTRIGLEPIHSLFVGVQPAALVFAHRGIEKHGDYLRLGTLAYDTLEWRAEWPCANALGDPLDPAIRAEIEQQVASMRAKAGQNFQISSSGQTVRLGGKQTTAEALKKLAHDLATANPGLTFAYDASGVYSLHGDKIIMAMSKAIGGEIVDLCDSPRDVTQHVKREALTIVPAVSANEAPLPEVRASGQVKQQTV
jgi:hypothetical protein